MLAIGLTLKVLSDWNERIPEKYGDTGVAWLEGGVGVVAIGFALFVSSYLSIPSTGELSEVLCQSDEPKKK